jgi:hypothetical protein
LKLQFNQSTQVASKKACFFFRNATPIGMLQPGYLVAFPYPNHQSTFQVITSVGFMVDGEAVTILSTEGSDSDH